MKWGKTYSYNMTVQFEDVDYQRVVHHPNFLKFCERARTAALEEEGYPFIDMLESGFGLVICDVRLRYMKPLFLGQKLSVETKIFAVSSASLRLTQVIHAGGDSVSKAVCDTEIDNWQTINELCFLADISLVHIESKNGSPRPFHDKFLETLGINTLADNVSELERQILLKEILRPKAVRIS